MHMLQTVQVWLQSINNYEGGVCIVAIGYKLRALWRTKWLVWCSSASIRGIFLKIRTSDSSCMGYELCKFGFDRSL